MVATKSYAKLEIPPVYQALYDMTISLNAGQIHRRLIPARTSLLLKLLNLPAN